MENTQQKAQNHQEPWQKIKNKPLKLKILIQNQTQKIKTPLLTKNPKHLKFTNTAHSITKTPHQWLSSSASSSARENLCSNQSKPTLPIQTKIHKPPSPTHHRSNPKSQNPQPIQTRIHSSTINPQITQTLMPIHTKTHESLLTHSMVPPKDHENQHRSTPKSTSTA